jgi:hypothetical protein
MPWRKIGTVGLYAGLVLLGGGSVWTYQHLTRTVPLQNRLTGLEVELILARDSIDLYQKINRRIGEENKWYRLVIPPESGVYYPAEIAHQFYLFGPQRGKYLELAFSTNKYFAHRRRKQGTGLRNIIDASTPHESFLYDILDSLNIVPNDEKNRDANAQKILYFVNSIPYHDKQEYYVKMPIETLAEGRGNCADLAVLMHSLMITAGLDAMIVFPTQGDSLDHAMVGVHGDFNEDRTRTYFVYPDSNGRRYFLCQPTGTDDKRYPILHKVGYSKRYPLTVIYQDSISVVENKKEWLAKPRSRRKR